MGQSRNKTGVDFEGEICERFGWEHISKSPKIKWSGNGRSNYQKIKSVNFDTSKFLPTEDSTFEKYDAITQTGDKVEIKKYNSTDITDWCLYSEPFFKISTKSGLKYVVDNFGNGDIDVAREKYNTFLEELLNKNFDYIVNNISNSNIGIQFNDKFVPKEKLDFRLKIYKSCWMGFWRATIEFKIKD